ncbi:AlpA family phage regulatory protein [Alcaligenes aquatilis]|uniref:AlpA family phage regulatory protein n=1 Tax=Alcaligenes aquatilis TaxID=323284 RepID=A0A3G2HZV0_9BURK|nr:AlpA family phage regulatory protein [Alcaligenes aquatilis]
MTKIIHRTALPPLAEDALISRAEFASRLGISLATLHRWVASGMLPSPVRLGRRHSVWHSSVVRATLRQLTHGDEAAMGRQASRVVKMD